MIALVAAIAMSQSLPTRNIPAPNIPTPTGDLRIMVWNVQRGANNFDQGAEKTQAWITAAKPDIVLMQESYDIDGDRPTLGRWIAEQEGWNAYQHTSPHLCIISLHPIEKTFFHADWHGVGAQIKTPKGSLVAYSTWIDYRAYTPQALRDNPDISDEDLLAKETTESDRLTQTKAIVQHLKDQNHLTGDLPLLVGGDWNCPSHLDWTDDTAKANRFRRNLPLPVSLHMAENGFVDVFRTVHPNPVNRPGITWSPLYRGTLETPETSDRIDRLYLHKAKSPKTLTPVGAFTLPLKWEDNNIEQKDRQFPSDHGAVIFDFKWSD